MPDLSFPLAASNAAAHNFIYLPDGWDTVWKAAKASAGSAQARLGIVGHSVVMGQNSTDFNSNSWAGKLRTNLVSRLGLGGDYYSTIRSDSASQTFGSVPYQGTPPWVANGASIGYASALGFGHMAWWSASSPAPAWTFTAPYAGANLEIVYYDRGAGTPGWGYTIDGGSETTVNTTGSGTVKKVTPATQSNAIHTIVINAKANNACAIDGISVFASTTSGLYTSIYGKQGATMALLGGSGQGIPQNYSGYNGSTYGNLIGPSCPHLFIMEMLVNDCNTGNVGPAEFGHRVRAWVEYMRRGRPNISILFLITSYPNATTMDSATGWTNYQSYQYYIAAIYAVAQAYGCAVVNMHAKWGSTSVAGGYRLTSDPHPVDAGHADVATTIGSVV